MTKDLIINDLIDKNNQLSNLIIRNAQNISTQELEETFNNVMTVQEKLSAIIGFQYILNPKEPLKNNEDIPFNLQIMTCTVFQYIIELMNKILYSLIYCLLIKYQSKIYVLCENRHNKYNLFKLTFADDFKNNLQLIDIYIDTDCGRHIFYEVKHKNNIKEYFQELINPNTYSAVKQHLLTLQGYKENTDLIIQRIISNHKGIKYTDCCIGYIFTFDIPSINNYRHYLDSFFLLHKDCSIDILNEIFNKLTYCGLNINWLMNAANIVQDIKIISDKLNQKVYIPNFQRNNMFNLSTGDIGLGKYTAQHHKDLINSFNKIRASMELDDYPLQQVIIHSHAYVIYIGTLPYHDIKYKIYVCRYFDKIKIKIMDNNKQISVRLKRKILNNIHLKKSLIDINKKYFTPDVTLMENIKAFLEKDKLI